MTFRTLLPAFLIGCLFCSPGFSEPQRIEEIAKRIRGDFDPRTPYLGASGLQVMVEFGVASWYDCPTKPELVVDRALKIRDYIYPIAHKTLPFGTFIKVINPANGKKILCRVIDRGPFISGRIIDLDRHGAKALGVSGIQRVATKIFCLDRIKYDQAIRKRRKS